MFEPEEKNINDISLKELTNRSEELGELLSRFADLEEQMGKLKAKTRELSEIIIPNMLSELGLSEITLKDGNKITTSTYYSARITDENLKKHSLG